MNGKVSRYLVIGGLIAGALWAWHNSLNGVFVLDDQSDIVNNPAIRALCPPAGVIGWPPPAQRPVTMLSFAANYYVHGLSVRGYHAVNLAIHLLAGLLLFGLVRRTLLLFPPVKGLNPAGIGGAVALLWLVHPLQTESVTYVIQRAESLAGLFHLLALYSALRAFGPGKRYWWSALAVMSCIVGVGAKESMAVAPLAVILFDRGFIYGSFRHAFRERWKLYSGMALSWAVLAVLLVSGPNYYAGLDNARYTLSEYIRTQPGVILHYLGLCLWPHPLVLDYGWPVARTAGEIIPGAVVVGALLGFLVIKFRSHPWACAVGLWGFLALAPSSSIFPLRDMTVEHRMYLPLASVVILSVVGVSVAISRLVSPRSAGWLKLGLLAAVSVPLMVMTENRNAVYGSAVRMYGEIVADRPLSVRGHHNLAFALAGEGRMDEALVHIRKAVDIMPDYAEGYYNLGYILSTLGRKGEAERAYRRALEIKPYYQHPAMKLAGLLRARDRGDEAGEVMRRMQAALVERL